MPRKISAGGEPCHGLARVVTTPDYLDYPDYLFDYS